MEKNTFRERLLASESTTPALRERYEREVHMLLEKKLTAPRRWGIYAILAVLAAQVAIFGYALFIPEEFPILGRIGFGVGVLFALAFAAVLVSVLKRGSVNLKDHPNTMIGIMWGFLVIMITLFMLVAGRLSDPTTGISMVLNGLVFLTFGVVFFLQNTVNQAQLKTEEKLLEIELRIAELAELMKKSGA